MQRRRSGGDEDDDGDDGVAALAAAGGGGGGAPKFAHMLKAKQICVGMRLWGAVLEVAARGLTVSLPHGLRGHVVPAEVWTRLFTPMGGKRD
eukprot:199588-Chlamydomonas_euryale.AAC.2